MWRTWGSTADERQLSLGCDLLEPRGEELWRAVTVQAPPERVFPWLCQLRVAPYSYDWIDNLGRPSPRNLTPGLERLEVGHRFMFVFRLADFTPGVQVTLTGWRTALTYTLRPAPEGCRLVVKLRVRLGWLLWPFAWGDLVMMRKQLLTLKALAEGR